MSGPGSFAFVEGATSDLAFVARGPTLESVFEAAAEALVAATVENPAAVHPRERRKLELADTQLDLLLLRFLNELIYLRDAEGLLLRARGLALERDGELRLVGVLEGEALDASRHERACDVKAATAHGLRVAEAPGGWEAHVTLDV
jgi:SHS2 domain-containing protein